MPILECQKVSKAYGGLLAVSDLSFAVEPGEVYAIVGPNGAGKTSLFDCISGVNPATSGVIKFKDREIQGLRAHQISRLGLARTFQTTVAFDSQTVLTNVLVGSTFGRDGENATLSFKNQAQADRILVIHHGQQITIGPPSTVLRDRRVIEVYLGNLVPMGPEASPPDA